MGPPRPRRQRLGALPGGTPRLLAQLLLTRIGRLTDLAMAAPPIRVAWSVQIAAAALRYPARVVALKILAGLIDHLVAFLSHPCEHVERRALAESARHDRHGGVNRAVGLGDLLREKHDCRREQNTPLARHVLFAAHIPVEVADLGAAVQVQLNDEKILVYVVGNLGIREDLLMHLLAVEASALLKEQNKALSFVVRLRQIIPHILESVAHPGLLVQAVVADLLCRHGQRHDNGQHCSDPCFHSGSPPRYDAVAGSARNRDPINSFSSRPSMTETCRSSIGRSGSPYRSQ